MEQIIAGMRPTRSAIQPNSMAPINWPVKPMAISPPTLAGAIFQSCTITGNTDAIASESKASKNVATPTMTRAFTCQLEIGRRSMRSGIV